MALATVSRDKPTDVLIGPGSVDAIGDVIAAMSIGGNAGALNATAQLCYYVPFQVQESITVYKVWWSNGGGVAGNCDVGVMSEDGRRLVSSGATAQATTNVIQEVDVTDTLLVPGRYYLAMATPNDTATSQLVRWAPPLGMMQAWGVLTQAAQASVPATATFADPGGAVIYLPVFGIARRTVAA